MNFLILDGETCNTPMIKGQLDIKSGQVYDLGGAIINEYGKEFTHFSIVNEDVFFRMPEQMKEAYYADKIPQYLEDMRLGKRKIMHTIDLYFVVRQLIKEYSVQAIVAHNAKFDIATLNATVRYQTKSRNRWFLPYGIKVIDSLVLAKKVYGTNPQYIAYCKEHGYMTNHATPRPRLTAEVLWRYISNNENFIESHTGLEDVEIEKEIFIKCLEALRTKAPKFRAGTFYTFVTIFLLTFATLGSII